MARLIGPDDREARRPGGSRAVGATWVFYAAPTGTALADIRTTDGAAIPGSSLTADLYGLCPLFLFPDGVDTVWVEVDGGPRTPVYARVDDRLDAVMADLAGKATPASVAADVAASEARARGTYARKWEPGTAYAASEVVVNPNGDLVVAVAAFTSGTTYNPVNWRRSAAANRNSQRRHHVEHHADNYFPWYQGAPTAFAPGSSSFGHLIRWTPNRDTTLYGVTLNITTQSGNVAVALYSESMEQLSTSGSVACPAAGIQMLHLPAGGVAVEGGKTYWICIGADNTLVRFAGWSLTANVVGSRMVIGNAGTNMFPPPATIVPSVNGFSIGTPNSGIVASPVTDPPRTAKPAAPLTMSIQAGSGQVYARDPATGRLFGSTGNGLATSDDNGASWTTSGFNRGNPVQAVIVLGDFVYVATGGGTPRVGQIDRMPRTGPYTNTGAATLLSGQEGAALPWNFVARPDGVFLVGNYDPQGNGATAVKILRSADFGVTWTTVLNLGASDNVTRHVHSIINLAGTTTWYANIGDTGVNTGVWKSTDDGVTWTKIAALGTLRLTPAVQVGDGVLWAADHFRMGGNLFWQNSPTDTKLQPRSHLDAPWHGDLYALIKDGNGVCWYVCRATNVSYTRSAIFASPDDGVTSYLVADLGAAASYSQTLLRAGNFLFCEGKRWDVSTLTFA